jgi:hypothetical protein
MPLVPHASKSLLLFRQWGTVDRASQHPLMHELWSHWHTPEMHWSLPKQVSHSPPPVPHAVLREPGRQTLPSQRPSGHEVASQMHAFALQRCPAAHAAAPPQPHVPSLRQEFDVPVQLTHAAPCSPQLDAPGVAQAPPLVQHPLSQVVESHTH